MSLVSDEDSRAYEEKHVHTVYQQIANHFSSTRHKVSYMGILLGLLAHRGSRGP
jgi:hypothetical protein